MSVYKVEKNDETHRELLGVCEVFCQKPQEPFDIKIIYFKTKDSKGFNNMININNLKEKISRHSMNQAFKSFNIIDEIDVIEKTNKIYYQRATSAYRYIRDSCMISYINEKFSQSKNRTIFVVMTDLSFALKNGDKTVYKGGGVMNKEHLAIMWHVPNAIADVYESIIHEIGHVLNLDDVHTDTTLGVPPDKYKNKLETNYMNYSAPKIMFFRSQIKTMYNTMKLNQIELK